MASDNEATNVIHSVSLTDRQLGMVRSALGEYLATFSHHEGDLLHEIKILLRSLPIERLVDPQRQTVPGPEEVSIR